MESNGSSLLENFRNDVGIKFQLFNSLFTSLPFHRIEKTGILLSMLLQNCEEGYEKNLSPVEIIDDFFSRHTSYHAADEQLDLLFRFVQYVERQVVLFDALEEAAFRNIHDFNGPGTLKQLHARVDASGQYSVLTELLKKFSIRLVLTAHPTQFYPSEVLGIINDLSKALRDDNTSLVNQYLQQLGKTPFFKPEKPSPLDEAISLIWYLENVFYPAAGRILFFMKRHFYEAVDNDNPIIRLGFWPGGDRDGNPFVTSDITLQVAEALRKSILKCYYLDIRKLRRRLTFKGVTKPLTHLENELYQMVFLNNPTARLQKETILQHLYEVRLVLKTKHNSLFIHLVENLINKVQLFGQHFASLDIRQDSSMHTRLLSALSQKDLGVPAHYNEMDAAEKIAFLAAAPPLPEGTTVEDPQLQDILDAMRAVRIIQAKNGEEGCHRYIISHCESALQVLEVLGLMRLAGWEGNQISIDIVPLFETIEDLNGAAFIMDELYKNDIYRKHITYRSNCQTVMLGFSDGTKDGGYFTANWSIYKAKDRLSSISRKHNVEVLFFDGRGGPPSRGGGKTHRFYASLGQNIANREIQLTIQGQTVSSNFGTIDAAQFNMEQLIDAGISSTLLESKLVTFSPEEEQWMDALSQVANQAYLSLRNHPQFLSYLANISPLRFYADTNIGSRPARRGNNSELSLKDLRAIPYVGAWSQLKQNVTGFYGVGAALEHFYKTDGWKELESLYQHSLFFRTLLDNCEMVMQKCYFPLTQHLAKHPQYAEIWEMIFAEYNRTLFMLKRISGHKELMENYPVEQMSVRMRERIILPLLTIQQYGLMQLANPAGINDGLRKKLEKLVMRCSFGIINAGRNSA